MRWIWAAAEAFAQWRARRAQKAERKWMKRARDLAKKRDAAQLDLFEGENV